MARMRQLRLQSFFDQKTNCLAPALDHVAPCPGVDVNQFFDSKLHSFRHNSSDARWQIGIAPQQILKRTRIHDRTRRSESIGPA
jgi:hypothetical protein